MKSPAWLSKLLRGDTSNDCYQFETIESGIRFYITPELLKQSNSDEASALLMHQRIGLSMLVEEGNATSIDNGFDVPAEVIAQLDDSSHALLKLPPKWCGEIKVDVKGLSKNPNFTVNIFIAGASGHQLQVQHYHLQGPLLVLSGQERYTLTLQQLVVFSSVLKHRLLDGNEYDNLQLIHSLQQAKATDEKLKLTLAHFKELSIEMPQRVSVASEITSEGDLKLIPSLSESVTPEQIDNCLSQLQQPGAATLRVSKTIVLLNEEKLAAVAEVLRNRRIPKDLIEHFLAQPSAYLDANLVDLDRGFSMRVKGVTKFKHAYFGESEATNLDWFGRAGAADQIKPIAAAIAVLQNTAELAELAQRCEDALAAGADTIELDEQWYDIADGSAVKKQLERAKHRLSIFDDELIEDDLDSEDEDLWPKAAPIIETAQCREYAVVDIAKNDENLDIGHTLQQATFEDMLESLAVLNWDNHRRKAFPHQVLGIRWILGMCRNFQYETELRGAILADDMGLGKTFMALTAIEQTYRAQIPADRKPALIVAPLSLLQNWQDEVEQSFKVSPFQDIVILQADAELKKYRCGNNEIRNQTIPNDVTATDPAQIRYSLKVGAGYDADRLDQPGRLVITTYQTMRDYQFSMCTVDWGYVVFDEAQNIKNPNAIQTRAAKGLKADFKLLATGTPVENSLRDFWCLMDTACPGYLGSHQEFLKEYVAPIANSIEPERSDIQLEKGRALRKVVGPLMLRRLKEDHIEGLPAKHIHIGDELDAQRYMPELHAIMTGKQLSAYEQVIDALEAQEQKDVLAALQQLRAISLHPRASDPKLMQDLSRQSFHLCVSESTKMERLLQVIEIVRAREEKCIVFVVNKNIQRLLSYVLSQHFKLPMVSVINGDTKAVDKTQSRRSKTTAKSTGTGTRKSIIQDFESKPGFNVIVMSPLAAGVGLTIVGANNVVHYERHWNPAKEAQATDRIYRIGQTKDVNVYVPLLHHPKFESFDVNLNKLLSQKTMTADAVVAVEDVNPSPGGIKDITSSRRKYFCAQDLQKLTWQQFEALALELIAKQKNGSARWLTPENDFGADGVVFYDDTGCLLQCKHTKTNHFNGYKAVQEIYGARIQYEQKLDRTFAELVFVTNAATIDQRALEMAINYDVRVVKFADLARLLDQHPISMNDLDLCLSKSRLQL